MALDYLHQRLLHSGERRVGAERERLGRLAAGLDALSPFKVLGRGYAITQRDSGAVVTAIDQVEVGETLHIRLADGTLRCKTEGKEKHKWQKKS